MSARKAVVALPPIVWVVRSAGKTEYGMLGSIKAFSMHNQGARWRLDPRLPDHKGLPCPSREFREVADAKAWAEVLREEWMDALRTAYTGQLRRAS
ncbi:hypothetical protein [Nonomuraea candida]|uniref:hypothetical protein n=1 Tax=Nonomuraea candida TaxID=359159 RepID=UPI0012F94567|nr:hypothetical protein [Nonomuraea candida]